MKSNFHMIREFKDFKPKQRGVIDEGEVKKIYEQFQLKDRTDVELQNLRDFVVMYYGRKNDAEFDADQWDVMSAITGVIDHEKWHRGMEV